MTLELKGRIDSNNAPSVEQELLEALAGQDEGPVVLDAAALDYISSAGLRILLRLKKQHPDLRVVNVGPQVYEILEMTGFTDMMPVSKAAAEKAGGPEAELEVEALTELLPEVQDFVERHLEQADCPMRALTQIGIAVEEIFVNIASYAYAPEIGKATVRVEVSGKPVCVTITFLDHGVPYDPLAKEDPDVDLAADERQIGGLGIFLTKSLMDDVSYEYRDGQNILTLKKKIS